MKIAGVKVGEIGALDVTPDKKAAITLDITSRGSRTSAGRDCTIRPQSLIGEKFVECTPTQPQPVGEPAAAPLQKIKDGKGKGEYLLPVPRPRRRWTSTCINNILRKPYAERLSIIINELGTAVAGNGKNLNQAIRRANPALARPTRS